MAEAMSALSGRPDWILLDLMLPDGDGADVLRKVPARSPVSRTCIISGCSAARVNEARLIGAEHVFTKPLDVARLIDVLTS